MEPDDGLPVSPAKEGFSHVPDSYPLDDTLTEPGDVVQMPTPSMGAEPSQAEGSAARRLQLVDAPLASTPASVVRKSDGGERNVAARVRLPQSPLSSRVALTARGPSYCNTADFARQFVISTTPTEGLKHGDVVVFMDANDCPYVVKNVDQDDVQNGALYAFAPDTEATLNMTNPGSYLEVNRQGKWIGFRSMYAQNRYLQARRKGMNRLCFYNAHFGTWEQFEFAHAEPKMTWTRIKMFFRSRRLPQYVLVVTVCRVGYLSSPESMLEKVLPADSQMAADGPGSKTQPLTRISNVMVKEWIKFVEKEFQERQEIEKRIEGLRKDTKLLHKWTTGCLQELKEHARTDINRLMDALNKTNSYVKYKKEQLESAESKIEAQGGHIDELLRQQQAYRLAALCFMAWRRRVADNTLYRHIHSQISHLRSRKLKAWAMRAWATTVADKRDRKAKAMRFADFRSKAALGRMLRAWQQSKDVLRHTRNLLQRHLRHAQSRKRLSLLHAWSSVVQSERLLRGRQQLFTTMARRRMLVRVQRCLAFWSAYASERSHLNHLLNFYTIKSQRVVMRRAYDALHAASRAVVRRRVIVRRFRDKAGYSRKHRTFSVWRALSELEGERCSQAMRFSRRRKRGRAFDAWKQYATVHVTTTNRTLESKCRRFVHVSRARHLRGAFVSWLACAKDVALARSKCNRLVRRRTTAVLGRVLDAWRTHVEGLGERVAEHWLARRESILRRCLSCWKHAAWVASKEGLKAGLQNKLVVESARHKLRRILVKWEEVAHASKYWANVSLFGGRRLLRFKAKRVVGAWRGIAQHHAAARDKASAHEIKRQALLLQRCLLAWAVAASHASEHTGTLAAKEVTLASRTRRRTLGNAVAAWLAEARRRASRRGNLIRAKRRIARLAKGAAFRAWLGLAQASSDDRVRVAHVQRRVARLTLRLRFESWTQAVVERRTYFDLMEKLMRRFRHNVLSRLFSGWRGSARVSLSYRRTFVRALERTTALRMGATLAAWRVRAEERRSRRRLKASLKARFTRATLVASVDAWQAEAIAQRALRHKASCITRKLARRTTARVLWAWHVRAVEERRLNVAYARLVFSFAQQEKARALHTWLGCVHAKRDAIRNIRRCIARKKISQKFFLNWYWDALDEDVQFTLNNVLNAAPERSDEEGDDRAEAENYVPLFRAAASPTPRRKSRDVNPLAPMNLAPAESASSYWNTPFQPLSLDSPSSGAPSGGRDAKTAARGTPQVDFTDIDFPHIDAYEGSDRSQSPSF